jgi:F-type H+-transporting ATPase subunit delta
MARTKVAQPWAKALLDLSVDAGTVPATREELDRMAALVASSSDLQNAFANPTVTVDDRKKVVVELATRLSLGRTVKNFLLLLADKRRLAYLRDIADAYRAFADAHEGVVRAEALSPVALSDAQLSRLRETLGTLTGRRVAVDVTVDPSLIGGLRVRVDGRVYDATVSRRLDALRSEILQSL